VGRSSLSRLRARSAAGRQQSQGGRHQPAQGCHPCGIASNAMHLATEGYTEQIVHWPADGRHILAHYDAHTIIVYQAYRPSIAEYVLKHGVFGQDFSFTRMSWIKPNFLWMMYRCGWATKANQQVVLGLRLSRPFFDAVLAQAVASSWEASGLHNRDDWTAAVAASDVRLQWDPDHDPKGRPVRRRAIQLGLRGGALEAFAKRELLEVIDMTEFVVAQRTVLNRTGVSELRMPVERRYLPSAPSLAQRLQLG